MTQHLDLDGKKQAMLEGKIALVTGGSRGLGRAIVLLFAESGADVVINYLRNDKAAQEVKELVESRGRRAYLIRTNVGDSKAVQAMFAEIEETFGRLDILVHNAALGSFIPVMDLKRYHWKITMETNAQALLVCSQQAVPLMEGRRGRIIAISSLGSHRVLPSYGAIGISKAALEALIRYLAVELAPRNIQVNGVSGGAIETDALLTHPLADTMREEVVRRTPAGRIGTVDDLAKVVLFLCSPASDWIMGQTIIADGGLDLT